MSDESPSFLRQKQALEDLECALLLNEGPRVQGLLDLPVAPLKELLPAQTALRQANGEKTEFQPLVKTQRELLYFVAEIERLGLSFHVFTD